MTGQSPGKKQLISIVYNLHDCATLCSWKKLIRRHLSHSRNAFMWAYEEGCDEEECLVIFSLFIYLMYPSVMSSFNDTLWSRIVTNWKHKRPESISFEFLDFIEITIQSFKALGGKPLNPNAAAFVPRNPQTVQPRQPTVTIVPKQTVSGQAIVPGTKQTLITNHVTHLPSHVLQQMYAGKNMFFSDNA